MKWNIVVDSGCDLNSLKRADADCGFTKVPIKIITNLGEFVDDGSHGLDELFTMLHASKGKSSSACPSPSEWAEAFSKADYTIAFSLTSTLSGCYNSALIGRDIALDEDANKKIFIMDTLTVGPEMTLLVYKASELIRTGLSFEEVCEELTAYREKTKLLFVIGSLDTLIKNGRVNKAVGAMIGMMKIRLLGKASEKGDIEVSDKARGFKKCVTGILALLANEGFRDGRMVIAHSFNEEEATTLAKAIHVSYPDAHISMMPAGGVCSYYTEEGGILLGFESAK